MSMVKITVYEVADMDAYHDAFGLDVFPNLSESMLRRIAKIKMVKDAPVAVEHYAHKIQEQIRRSVCYNILDLDPKRDKYDGCYYVQIDHFNVNGFAVGDSYNPTLIFKYEEVSD